MPSAAPAIVVESLSRRFGEIDALKGVSFAVQTGEVFGCLGHNGAGKTTCVRLMNGVLAPTAGRLRVLGIDPAADGSQLRQRTGVLTEAPSLDERLTAVENLNVYAHLYGVPEPTVQDRIHDLLERFDLTHRAADRVGGFSKGMKQRLALARALLHQPELLFLDEPTAGLDPVAAREVHELIEELRRQGRTIFLCTHNLVEAQRLCDRVAVLRQGELVALGSVAALSQQWDGPRQVEFEVATKQLPAALECLRSALGSENVRQTREVIVCGEIDRAGTAAAVSALAQAGIALYRVSPQDISLEQVYFGLHLQGDGE